MLNKTRNFVYKYAIVSSIIIAILCYFLMIGVSKLFALIPSSTPVEYVKTFVDMIYPVGIVFLFGFGSAFKEKGFFKGLYVSLTLIIFQLLLSTPFLKALRLSRGILLF